MATPEFILRLREKIGHDPLWLIGITAYVENDEARYCWVNVPIQASGRLSMVSTSW